MNYRFCPCCGAALEQRRPKPSEPDRLVCCGCEFIFYLDPKLAAGALVVHDGRILLLRRAIEPRFGMWVFPGGFVDRGEHPEQAAIREAREEAGIDVALQGLVGVYHEPPGSLVVLVVYRAELIAGEAQAADESLEAAWFQPETLPWSELAFPTTRAALSDFLAR
jgi:8-oxo-dGTP diphosphatase